VAVESPITGSADASTATALYLYGVTWAEATRPQQLITIDARIVIASVDTYLRFAEQVNRLDLTQTEAAGLKELRDGGGNGDGKAKGMAEGAKDALSGDGDRKQERAERS